MTDYSHISDLLEQYMKETGSSSQWITVWEFRQHFQLPTDFAHPVSGFLTRLHKRKPSQFPYIVSRIERGKYRSLTRGYQLRYYVQPKEKR